MVQEKPQLSAIWWDFLKPDNGTVTVNGLNVWKDATEIKKYVSYVPGEIAFPSLATETDFLKLQADYLGVKDFTYMNHVISLLQLDTSANLKRMLMYGKEASNRKQEIDRQHYTIPNQRPKDKHCGKI